MQPGHDREDGFVGYWYMESRNTDNTLPAAAVILIIDQDARWPGIITVDDRIVEKLDGQP
jgi:hypothetical protein